MKTLLFCFALLPAISIAQDAQDEQEQGPPINVECNCPEAPRPVQREESWEEEDRRTLEKEQEQLPGQSNDQFVDPVREEMEREEE